MRNIVLGPVIVIGCAVIGVIAGALYFAAVLGVLEWMSGVASAADDLGRRASFPAFAFGLPAGALIGFRLADASLREEESWASVAGIMLAVLVALPCIVLPLYASAVPAFKVLVLIGANKTATMLGYLSILGVGALAFGSNRLLDGRAGGRFSASR